MKKLILSLTTAFIISCSGTKTFSGPVEYHALVIEVKEVNDNGRVILIAKRIGTEEIKTYSYFYPTQKGDTIALSRNWIIK